MLENQIVQWYDHIPNDECTFPVLSHGIEVFVPGTSNRVDFIKMNGEYAGLCNDIYGAYDDSYEIIDTNDMGGIELSDSDCFYFRASQVVEDFTGMEEAYEYVGSMYSSAYIFHYGTTKIYADVQYGILNFSMRLSGAGDRTPTGFRGRIKVIDSGNDIVADVPFTIGNNIYNQYALLLRNSASGLLRLDIYVTNTDDNPDWRGSVTLSLSMLDTFQEVVQPLYSNPLKYIEEPDTDELAIVKYRCDEDAFGIPFSKIDSFLYACLPLRLHSPQYKQSEEVYEKLDGENVVLFSASSKEYELETEYLPEEWHDRIMLILQCDHVYINDKSVHKSGDYSVDWEKSAKMDCGKRIAKATCKVIENIVSRNSN